MPRLKYRNPVTGEYEALDVEGKVPKELSDQVEKNKEDVGELKAALSRKIEKPDNAAVVGKVLKIKTVNEDGSFVCEWADDVAGQSTDVQINGTSITQDGVANIPISKNDTVGLAKPHAFYGTGTLNDGTIYIVQANQEKINNRGSYQPIVPSSLDYAVRTSLTDGKNVFSDTEKAAACETIGADTTAWKRIEVTTAEEARELSVYCGENVHEMLLYQITPPFAYNNVNSYTRVLTAKRADPYGFAGGSFNPATSQYDAYKHVHVIVAGKRISIHATEKYNLSVQVSYMFGCVGVGKIQDDDRVTGVRIICYDSSDKLPVGTKAIVLWR